MYYLSFRLAGAEFAYNYFNPSNGWRNRAKHPLNGCSKTSRIDEIILTLNFINNVVTTAIVYRIQFESHDAL